MCRALSNPYPSAYQMTQWCFDGHVSQENMSCWKVWKNCVWVGNKNRKQQKLDGVPLKEASLFKTCFVQEGQQNQQFYFPLFRCCWFYLQFRILSVLSLSVMINGIWCKKQQPVRCHSWLDCYPRGLFGYCFLDDLSVHICDKNNRKENK